MIVGVVPAAGRATRLGPLTGSKELLEVRGAPVMDHLLQRLRAAAPDEVRVVTRPAKSDVTAHARARGATVVHGEPADVAASLALGVSGLADDTVVLLGFPDTLWEPADGFVRVLRLLDGATDVALGLFRTPEVLRSDHVHLDGAGRVERIEPKPAAPRDQLIWGIAATTAAVVRAVPPGEEPGAHFGRLAAQGRVAGLHLSDAWIDVGVPDALARARAGAVQ